MLIRNSQKKPFSIILLKSIPNWIYSKQEMSTHVLADFLIFSLDFKGMFDKYRSTFVHTICVRNRLI